MREGPADSVVQVSSNFCRLEVSSESTGLAAQLSLPPRKNSYMTNNLSDVLNKVSFGDLDAVYEAYDRAIHQETLSECALEIVKGLLAAAQVHPSLFPVIAHLTATLGIYQAEWIVLLPPYGIRSIASPSSKYAIGVEDPRHHILLECRKYMSRFSHTALQKTALGDESARRAAMYLAFWHLYETAEFFYLLCESNVSYLNTEVLERVIMASMMEDSKRLKISELGNFKNNLLFKSLTSAWSDESYQMVSKCVDEYISVTGLLWDEGTIELHLLAARAKDGNGYGEVFELLYEALKSKPFRVLGIFKLTLDLRDFLNEKDIKIVRQTARRCPNLVESQALIEETAKAR
jgi:hypothetical protein